MAADARAEIGSTPGPRGTPVRNAGTAPVGVALVCPPFRRLTHCQRTRTLSVVEREKEMKAVAENLLQQDGSSFSSLLRDPLHRKCLLVGCSIVVLQQLTGQPNVLYYSATIFKSAGFDTDRKAALANLSLGVAKVAATAFAIAKVDNMGRRRLLLVGSSIMVASLVILGSITAAYPPIARNSTDPSQVRTRIRRAMPSSASSTIVDVFSHCLASFSLPGLFPTHHGCCQEPSLQFESAAVKWTSMACLVLFVVAYAFRYAPLVFLAPSQLAFDLLST